MTTGVVADKWIHYKILAWFLPEGIELESWD